MRQLFILLALLTGQAALANDKLASEKCPSQSSTHAINACAQQDYDAADRALNAAYKKARATLVATEKAALLAEQRAWLKARDPRCKQAFESEEGGSIWTSLYTTCLADATRERTAQLRNWKKKTP